MYLTGVSEHPRRASRTPRTRARGLLIKLLKGTRPGSACATKAFASARKYYIIGSRGLLQVQEEFCSLRAVDDMDYNDFVGADAPRARGKIEITGRRRSKRDRDALLLHPGVAEPCRERVPGPGKPSGSSTRAGNLSPPSQADSPCSGSGHGAAAMPVVEGKALLFKGVRRRGRRASASERARGAEIIAAVRLSQLRRRRASRISPAPKCFEIEEVLERELGIPVFDDQHGTAIVVSAALSTRSVAATLADCRIILNGPGA